MKNNTPEKEGFDCGPGRINTSVPPRDEAQWGSNEPRNYDDSFKKAVPFDGLDATTWDAVMAHGVSIDNVQKSPNAKASLKDS